MKAWVLPSQDGIGALRIEDLPDPTAGAGEVVLALDYAALNPADRYLSEKMYPATPSMPHVLGRDGIGTVVAVGPGVDNLHLGDRRAILRGETGVSRHGTFAQKVAVAADSLIEVPAGWTDQEAAGAALVYLTSWQALTQWEDLPANSLVLVSGASGGVGVATVQLAHAMGHAVVALSRDDQKRERLASLGAQFTIDPSSDLWSKQTLEATGGRRVDLAIDNIGGPMFPRIIETLAERGRVSAVGMLAGPVPQFNTASLFFRRLRIGGVAVGSYGAVNGQAAWKQLVATLARSHARPLVDHVFNFKDLPAAFDRLRRGPMGKVLLALK